MIEPPPLREKVLYKHRSGNTLKCYNKDIGHEEQDSY